MKKFALGLAIAALASAGPAFAGDKNKMKNQESGSGTMQKSAADGRGGLAEWPVSKTEADWSNAAPGSSSTGESSGSSGSGASGSSSNSNASGSSSDSGAGGSSSDR